MESEQVPLHQRRDHDRQAHEEKAEDQGCGHIDGWQFPARLAHAGIKWRHGFDLRAQVSYVLSCLVIIAGLALAPTRGHAWPSVGVDIRYIGNGYQCIAVNVLNAPEVYMTYRLGIVARLEHDGIGKAGRMRFFIPRCINIRNASDNVYKALDRCEFRSLTGAHPEELLFCLARIQYPFIEREGFNDGSNIITIPVRLPDSALWRDNAYKWSVNTLGWAMTNIFDSHIKSKYHVIFSNINAGYFRAFDFQPWSVAVLGDVGLSLGLAEGFVGESSGTSRDQYGNRRPDEGPPPIELLCGTVLFLCGMPWLMLCIYRLRGSTWLFAFGVSASGIGGGLMLDYALDKLTS